jgi:hypothetical protein
LPIFTL